LQLNARVMTGLWGREDLGGKGGRVGPSEMGTIDTYGVHYSEMPSHISSGLDIHSITSPPGHILYSVETSKKHSRLQPIHFTGLGTLHRMG